MTKQLGIWLRQAAQFAYDAAMLTALAVCVLGWAAYKITRTYAPRVLGFGLLLVAWPLVLVIVGPLVLAASLHARRAGRRVQIFPP